MNETWHPVVPLAEFPIDGKTTAEIRGWQVLLVKTAEGLFALNDRCPHQGFRLSFGKVRQSGVICRLHGGRFELKTGRCVGGPYKDVRVFMTRVRGGMIEISLPPDQPTADDLPMPAS